MSTHRAMGWRRLASATVVLLSTTAVAACGLPDLVTRSSDGAGLGTVRPTPTRTPQPPESPGIEVKSANAFVRHWVTAYNEALTSGDLDDLNDLASRKCESCLVVTDPIADLYDAGGRIKTKGWELRKLRVLPTGNPRGSRAVFVRVYQHPQRVVPEAGAPMETVNPRKRELTFHVTSLDGAWLLTRLSQRT